MKVRNPWFSIVAALALARCSAGVDAPEAPTTAEDNPLVQQLRASEDFNRMATDMQTRGWVISWGVVRERRSPNASADERLVEVQMRRTQGTNTTTGWAGLVQSGTTTTAFVNVPGGMNASTDGAVASTSQAVTISTANCAPYSCDYPFAITLAWYCWNPESNPVGYALRRIFRRGYSTCNTTRYGRTSNPSYYTNRCGNLVVCPGVELSMGTYITCANMENPSSLCQ